VAESLFRHQATTRLRPDDLHVMVPGGTSIADEFWEAAPVDHLTANGLTVGAPSLATPTISQIHILSCAAITTTPSLSTPTLAQVHALSGNGLTTTPALGIPALSIQIDLTANGIVAGIPSLGIPTFAQTHALGAAGLTTTSALATPVITQTHVLAASGITANPILGIPTVSQEHVLSAAGITTMPALAQPLITQLHVFTTDGFATGAPVFDTPILQEGGIDELTSDGLTIGIPSFADVIFNQICVLAANEVLMGLPTLSELELAQIHRLIAGEPQATPLRHPTAKYYPPRRRSTSLQLKEYDKETRFVMGPVGKR